MSSASHAQRTDHVAAPRPAALVAWLARHETPAVLGLLALAVGARVVRFLVTAVMHNDGPVFLAIAQTMARLSELEAELETAYARWEELEALR